ncbi:alpha-E domain-containing protein [Deminuibacter soli]|uniref:Alpha-E domain-containing protein n=1 Tax=Deminuibacter soli TaxID=2291815 RepID=A0A3E1NDG2_9BACT|nr:alpha-E domain-containing protein [Deminuibacter soli]RFM25970.1 alpha-E domain-containing protein [Deminuibacter soli]
MLSRIADALFWLNRYMERADGLLRTTSTHFTLSLDKGVNGPLNWRPLLETYVPGNEAEISALENDTQGALQKLITDTGNHNSLRILISKARENARGVQDHITKEMWEEVNQLYHVVNHPALNNRLNAHQAMDVLGLLSRHCVMYNGITDITMARGTGWSFMNIGKYLERSLETILLTDKQFGRIGYRMDDAQDIMQWRYLLLSLSGYELHLKSYRSVHYNKNVLQQVLINRDFTRSVIYSLNRIEKHLKDIPTDNQNADHIRLCSNFGRLFSKVQYLDFDTLNNQTLRPFLAELQTDLSTFGQLLGQHFFSYS